MACRVVPVFSGLFLRGGLCCPQELTHLEGVTRPLSSGSPEWGSALGRAPLLFCHPLGHAEFCVEKEEFQTIKKNSLSLCKSLMYMDSGTFSLLKDGALAIHALARPSCSPFLVLSRLAVLMLVATGPAGLGQRRETPSTVQF